MNLDMDALRAFVAIADQRRFTRAASTVARTQSSVSVMIKNLDGRLGFALFERTKRSVALTPRGERLLAYARDILRLNDEGVREAIASPVAAHLAVACLTRSALRPEFQLLGAREGLPRLPDSEIVLFAPRRVGGAAARQLADVAREHFALPLPG